MNRCAPLPYPRHGPPEVLKVVEYPNPIPGPGQVRINVKACGLNFAELMARQGLYPDAPAPPCVVGYELSGTIDAVADDVGAFAIGDRVLAAVRFGAHAERVCANVDQVYAMPDGMSFEDAAAPPVNYRTAYRMIRHAANVQPGEHVLIHAAAGGVGCAALQVCRTIDNVTTYGTASAGKHALIRELGCTHPIDYHSVDYATDVRRLTGGAGVDVVLDALGGRDWKTGYELLKPMGRLVAFGFANMATSGRRNLLDVAWQMATLPRFSPLQIMNENKTIAGVNLGGLWEHIHLLRADMMQLLALYEAGHIRPQIDSTYTFAQAAEAHLRMQNRANVGKILLIP